MLMNRRTLLAAAATVPAMARAQAPATGAPIRIGVMFDLTGPFAAAGSQAHFIGAEAALELFNERGGIGGRRVEAITADSQSRTEVAINEAERLLGGGVEALVATYSSAHAVPLSQRMEAARKVYWIVGAVSTAVFKGRNLTYVFRPQPHSDQYGEASVGMIAHHAQAKLGVPASQVRCAVIYEDGPYGTGVASSNEAALRAAGMPMVMKEAYSAAAPDLSSMITKLRRERPDVVLHTGYNPDITLFFRQGKAGGLRFKSLIGHGGGYAQIDRLADTFGADMDHVCNVDPPPAQLVDASKLAPGVADLTGEYIRRYTQKTNSRDLPVHGAVGFNHMWTFLEYVLKPAAMRGPITPDSLREAALAVDLPEGGTIQGHGIRFARPGSEMAGQNERSSLAVMQYAGGRARVVWPRSIAAGDPTLPLPPGHAFAAR